MTNIKNQLVRIGCRDFINFKYHLAFHIINLYAHTNTSNYGTRKDFLFCFPLQLADVLKLAKI